ncbi:MAG: hypothetical protein ABJO27_14215 [Pseudoruegeria sp.]
MSNSLQDLNKHLFDQLHRLSNTDLDADQIELEAKRAEAIVAISDQSTKIADLSIKAAKLYAENGHAVLNMLPQIGSDKE